MSSKGKQRGDLKQKSGKVHECGSKRESKEGEDDDAVKGRWKHAFNCS